MRKRNQEKCVFLVLPVFAWPQIVQAQLFSVPPAGLVALAVADGQTSVLQAVARHCPALLPEDLTALLAFAFSANYKQQASSHSDVGFSNQLLLSVVEHQHCPAKIGLEPTQVRES